MTRHEGTKARRHEGGGAFAFTIVELLVVMAVIIVLLSILIVAVSAATRSSQAASTRALMNSIKQGLVSFKTDVGYYPPVLGDPNPSEGTANNHDLRRLFSPLGEDGQWNTSDDIVPEVQIIDPPLPNTNYATNVQTWHSVTSLAEYLIGYGHHNQDGWGWIPPSLGGPLYDNERPPVGIRHPGPDGVWGATFSGGGGSLLARMQSQTSSSIDTGAVLGPYIDLEDERLLATAFLKQTGEFHMTFPGEIGYDPNGPKVIVDYWGNPIRYYRRLYAPGRLGSDFRVFRSDTPRPTLSDVFVLRPYEISPGAAIDSPHADAAGDTSTTVALNAAEFALFSPGPDKAFDEEARYDLEDFDADGVDFSNEDNIVEIGP